MKQELLDLIHLNTYIDYSGNKATDEDIETLVSRRRLKFDNAYLDFLRQLNGFKMYDLNIFGTKTQDNLEVGEVYYYNDWYSEENPTLDGYFVIGYCSDAFYVYHLEHKQYSSLQFPGKGVPGGREFNNLDALLDWAVKASAKRLNEQPEIIHKKALLYIANHITAFLENHGFQKDHGNILLNSEYQFVRIIPQATEQLWTGFQTNSSRDKLTLIFSVFKRYERIETYFEADYMKKARFRDNQNFTVMLYEDLPTYQSDFSAQELNKDYEDNTTRIISFIETYIFRAFTLYDNIKVLDAKVNQTLDGIGNLQNGNAHSFHKMIIAKLSGNPGYDDIFKCVKDRFEKQSKEFFNLTLCLNEVLQQTSPLKDGRLI